MSYSNGSNISQYHSDAQAPIARGLRDGARVARNTAIHENSLADSAKSLANQVNNSRLNPYNSTKGLAEAVGRAYSKKN